MLGTNMSNVDAAGNYARPKAGGYVIRIKAVNNDKPKERIEVEFDIYEGEFKGYYADLYERAGFWAGKFTKSYKEKALPFFRAFLEAVIASNIDTEGLIIGDFEDVDETKLVGMVVGMVVGEREYIGNDGKQKTALDNYNAIFKSVEDVRNGKYTVPEFKPLQPAPQEASNGVVDMSAPASSNDAVPDGFGPVDDADIPF